MKIPDDLLNDLLADIEFPNLGCDEQLKHDLKHSFSESILKHLPVFAELERLKMENRKARLIIGILKGIDLNID